MRAYCLAMSVSRSVVMRGKVYSELLEIDSGEDSRCGREDQGARDMNSLAMLKGRRHGWNKLRRTATVVSNFSPLATMAGQGV
jgi:hypothetical protein